MPGALIEVDTVDLPFRFLSHVNLVNIGSGERRKLAGDETWALFMQRDPLKPWAGRSGAE